MLHDWAPESTVSAQPAKTEYENLVIPRQLRYKTVGCQTEGAVESAGVVQSNVKHSSTQTDAQPATNARYKDSGCQTELDTRSDAVALYLPQSATTARYKDSGCQTELNDTETEQLISKMKARSLPARPKTSPMEKTEKMTVASVKVDKNENKSVEIDHKVKGEKEKDWENIEMGEGENEDVD
jgi:hypothetical protein